MRISGISFASPNESVSNQEVLKTIEHIIKDSCQDDLDEILDAVNNKFIHAGIEERRLYPPDTPWFPTVQSAITGALNEAETTIEDVDCIIYCSVYRTVFEPAMSCLIAKAMGMRRASTFDVNEACGSWARGVSIAQGYLKAGMYKNILLVTNEVFDKKKYEKVKLKKVEDLEWAFPTYTLGSGATATLLVNSDDIWDIQYGADNNLAEHCLFPLVFPQDHEHQIGDVNSLGQGRSIFTCYGRKMQLATFKQVVRFLKDKTELIDQSDIFLPHTQAYKPYLELTKVLGVKANIYSLFPLYGNIITNSIPASIAEARDKKMLSRGDKIFGVIPASGLSMSSLYFRF